MQEALTRSLMLGLCALMWLPTLDASAAEPLRLRLESAIGTQTCINSDTAMCSGYPTSFEDQSTGAYGRIGATIILPGALSFLSGGMLLDVGGFSVHSRRLTSATSVSMHLSAVVRAQIPIADTRYESHVGAGFGLAHLSPGNGASWTGMTIPVSVSLGYAVHDKVYLGGEFTFFPHLAGGDAPHAIQFGIYASYRLDIDLGKSTPSETSDVEDGSEMMP